MFKWVKKLPKQKVCVNLDYMIQANNRFSDAIVRLNKNELFYSTYSGDYTNIKWVH
jgi:hypothetical protein